MTRRAGARQDIRLFWLALRPEAPRYAWEDAPRRYVPKLQTGPLAVFPAMVFDTIFQK